MNKELDNVEVGSERFKQLTVDSKKLRDEIKGADRQATGRFQANDGNYKGRDYRCISADGDSLFQV